ncbi:hypothetical protein [Alteromonas halophila]|uniref:Uncharacterized protein n=1 Tax=Alteromonas halophila TaxID=516698 RepID=A0A918JGI6_9ALTE|nr:hypothetical protein [Alteromonas halophila]GGW74942.1 hypothetical protein GCM10007391_03890 [Alteromonas halophila]
MLLLDKIIDALSDLVVTLPKAQQYNRQELVDFTVSVQAEIERAIELAILYIDGTKRIGSEQELILHLQGASSGLMNVYNEFKVCVGLSGLADRFEQIFSSTHDAAIVGEVKEVNALFRDLANGESLVIDGLRGINKKMYAYGCELSVLSDEAFAAKRTEVVERLELEVQSMRAQLNVFRTSLQDILPLM